MSESSRPPFRYYGTFPPLTGTPEAFERELGELGVDCEVLTLAAGGRL